MTVDVRVVLDNHNFTDQVWPLDKCPEITEPVTMSNKTMYCVQKFVSEVIEHLKCSIDITLSINCVQNFNKQYERLNELIAWLNANVMVRRVILEPTGNLDGLDFSHTCLWRCRTFELDFTLRHQLTRIRAAKLVAVHFDKTTSRSINSVHEVIESFVDAGQNVAIVGFGGFTLNNSMRMVSSQFSGGAVSIDMSYLTSGVDEVLHIMPHVTIYPTGQIRTETRLNAPLAKLEVIEDFDYAALKAAYNQGGALLVPCGACEERDTSVWEERVK